MDWAFSSFSDRQLVDTETVLTTIPLTKCRTEEAVELYAASGLSGYGHADDEVTFEFSVPESTSATVKEGAVLGTATVYLDGYEMGTVDLVTHKEYVSDFRTDAKTTLLLMAALIGIPHRAGLPDDGGRRRFAEPAAAESVPQKIIESNRNSKSSPEGELLLYPSFAARTESVILGFTCAASR